MTNWLERLNQLYTHRCSCTLLSGDRVISVTRLVGLRPIHPCAHRAFCSHPFKCLHIQGTVIYSKGPSHIWWCMTVFHFYSCRPTLCGWLCRLDRAVCACVAEEVEQDWGAREEWLCETATDRQMGGGGGGGGGGGRGGGGGGKGGGRGGGGGGGGWGGWGCKGVRLIKSGAADGWREAALGIAVS